jgi:DNA-binding HxlR family transcriptional regulator
MLTRQLRELEAAGLIHREVYAEVPPRVEYSLTALGRSLEPVIRSLWTWGSTYLEVRRTGPRGLGGVSASALRAN